jgi:two-component system sensor histidine kinase KdpD
VAALACVTGAIYGFRTFTPVLSLGALYLFAVLPVAIFWGRAFAVPVAVASMLALNFFFLPPVHTFTLRDRANWFGLAVYLVVAVVVSDLAARSRQRAAEAEQREREEALLAELSIALLQGGEIPQQLARAGSAAAAVLGVERARIELGPPREPPPGESPLELLAGDRVLGTLYVKEGPDPNLAIRRRFLPALASLVAVAVDRERLARDALRAQELEQSDTVKTAILRTVSHDLRSPLTAIRVAAESLASGSLELAADDRHALLDTVRIEIERLERVVQNLLDLSRLEAGAVQPKPELVALDSLIAASLAELGADERRVTVSLPSDVPVIQADAAQIERCLVNVLENALKFSPPGAPVHIRVTSTRKEVIVRVIDQGPGLGAEDIDQVFEPFRQVAFAGEAMGTGLGLAIAKGFAEANGGRVWVESRLGQGASFALAFPTVAAPAEVGS